MKKIGFIGLGIMGKPMAKNLLKAGFSLTVYDLGAKAVQELAACGASAADSIAAACSGADIVVTMLPNSPQVREVALGEGGILCSARPGTLYIDMSSIAPAAAVEVGKTLSQKGIRMLDAPVSGGEPKAVDGTLAIMAGGADADFQEASPVFEVLGASHLLVGELGAGNTCKLVNQVIVALNIAALSEGLMLAKQSGADPEKVYNAIQGGLAGSTVMNAKAPMMLEGNFAPGFRIDLHIKDLHNALDTGFDCGAPLPLTSLAMQMLENLKAGGYGSEDHSAMVRYYEKLAGVSIAGE